MKKATIFSFIFSLIMIPIAFCDDSIIIHEWGTITTQHHPDGTVQGRLNRITDSEVLPSFVHQYEPTQTRHNPQQQLGKSPSVPGRPDVTMRLETPVIYFYPPKDFKHSTSFDINVNFRGGVLNEYYPKAQASVSLDDDRIQSKSQSGIIKSWNGDVLNNYVLGSLTWKDVRISDSNDFPSTDNNIWLAPRQVNSKSIVNSSGEIEKYIFYRGVAHLDALFQTIHSCSKKSSSDRSLENTDPSCKISLYAPKHLHWLSANSMNLVKVWIADIREDGTTAFYERENIVLSKEKTSEELMQLSFSSKNEYSSTNMMNLKNSMRQALVNQGLFEAEADALLATWEESYYGRSGLRVFYIVPQEWINYFLPLQVSVPHKLTRVLVGRIDLRKP